MLLYREMWHPDISQVLFCKGYQYRPLHSIIWMLYREAPRIFQDRCLQNVSAVRRSSGSLSLLTFLFWHLFTFLYVSRSDIKTTQCKTVTSEYIRSAWRKEFYDWTDFDQVCSHKGQHRDTWKVQSVLIKMSNFDLFIFKLNVNVSADLFSCNRPRIWHLSIFHRYCILSKTHILHVTFMRCFNLGQQMC